MATTVTVNLPKELYQEVNAYIQTEGQTLNEFVIWALSEKVTEIRQKRGLKTLTQPPTLNRERDTENAPKIASVPKLLRAEEMAEQLQISKGMVYRLMQRLELPTVRLGRSVRVRQEDFEAFVQKQRNQYGDNWLENPTGKPK